ncbi:MAG TPA: hypothetical protein PKC72_12975 [Chitinophagaceae bacterium]|nr:hypothetical protein [Chitinophagaceae bacterium]
MKRPGLFVVILLFTSVFSTVVISTVISGIAKTFQKSEIQNVKVKSVSAENSQSMIHASVEL